MSSEPHPADELFSKLYGELRLMARRRLRGYESITLLDTTSLVHESYFRFVNTGETLHLDRSQFLAYASRAMRSVIVDLVRERQAERRGGGVPKLDLAEIEVAHAQAGEEEILRVSDALDELAKADGRLAQVVEMRFFAGLEEQEIAAALGVTDRTVRRDWQKARLLLALALQ